MEAAVTEDDSGETLSKQEKQLGGDISKPFFLPILYLLNVIIWELLSHGLNH